MKNNTKIIDKQVKLKDLPMERRLLKFSESKVKKLTIDYEDQTLGGMRKFEETILPDGIRRTYTYAVEFTKFIKKSPQPSAGETGGEKIGGHQKEGRNPISELYKECKINVIVENNDDGRAKENKRETRGRPRKYPVGEEPYRRKKALVDSGKNTGHALGQGMILEHINNGLPAGDSAFEAPATPVCAENTTEIGAINNMKACLSMPEEDIEAKVEK